MEGEYCFCGDIEHVYNVQCLLLFTLFGQLPIPHLKSIIFTPRSICYYLDELEAVKEQVGAPWKPPAKPPAAPPPADSPPPDPDEPEDVYDIPSEAVEQAAAGGMGKPPAPPPATPPPIDEDIYDMGDDEEEEEPTPPPAAPVPFQPARPPKSSPFNDRRGPPFSTFQPPHLAKPPIGGGPKAPAAPPPNSPPAVLVSINWSLIMNE